jgi:membrane-associated phospholipid phosphatase
MLPTGVDELVPFSTESVLVYGGIYALALTPLCLLRDRQVLLRSAAAYGLLLLAAVPWWFLMPVTVPRVPVPVDDVLSWGVAFVRYFDPPANCFPSMHVGETVLAALICWRLDRSTGAVVGLLAGLVWWSTLALDQHWFVDGLFGAGLAVLVDALCFRWRPLPRESWSRLSRWNLLWCLALYLAQFVVAAAPWWLGVTAPANIGAG